MRATHYILSNPGNNFIIPRTVKMHEAKRVADGDSQQFTTVQSSCPLIELCVSLNDNGIVSFKKVIIA